MDDAFASFETYDNPFHAANRYVRFRCDRYDMAGSARLWSAIREREGKPLQVTADASDHALTGFLKAGGFRLRRRCYEMEVRQDDLRADAPDGPEPAVCEAPSEDYAACCRLLFAHYRSTHEAISPLTASFERFCAALPLRAYVDKRGTEVVSAAFVEEGEIAYVCTADDAGFSVFAARVARAMLGKSETVSFESDDCDPAAMALKALFACGSVHVSETYTLA